MPSNKNAAGLISASLRQEPGNGHAVYPFEEFPGTELKEIITGDGGADKRRTVSGNVPLEYLHLLYRL